MLNRRSSYVVVGDIRYVRRRGMGPCHSLVLHSQHLLQVRRGADAGRSYAHAAFLVAVSGFMAADYCDCVCWTIAISRP